MPGEELFSNIMPKIDVGALSYSMGQAMQVLIVFVCIGVFVFIGFKKKIFFKFPTKFYIYPVMGGKLTGVREDFGRRVIKRKNGVVTDFYYDIKKADFKWHPPSYEFMLGTGEKGRAAVHVREISHQNWESFDPEKLVKAEALEYKSAEKRELDDYFKTTQDSAAKFKYALEKDKYQRIIDVIPAFLMLVGIGLAISLAIGPLGELYAASMGANNGVLDRSVTVLDRSNTIFNAALRFCGQSQTCMAALGINVTSNSSVIP